MGLTCQEQHPSTISSPAERPPAGSLLLTGFFVFIRPDPETHPNLKRATTLIAI
jgi:hypothetical protein